MYEELVKSLRKCGRLNMGDECVCFHDGCCEAEPTCMYELMRQAADAIEELYQTVEHYKGCANDWYKEACDYKAALPRWIPVTERLPKAYEEVMLQFPNNQAVGFCDRDGCWGVYSGDGFYTEVAENEPKPTHWAKKMPEPPKEEA